MRSICLISAKIIGFLIVLKKTDSLANVEFRKKVIENYHV